MFATLVAHNEFQECFLKQLGVNRKVATTQSALQGRLFLTVLFLFQSYLQMAQGRLSPLFEAGEGKWDFTSYSTR